MGFARSFRFAHDVGRAFLDVHADEEDEKRRRDPDEEHTAPPDAVEQGEINEAGDEIAGRIAALEQARHGAPEPGRNGLHDEACADPHSPPMAKPNRVRMTSSSVSERANPTAPRRPKRRG